MGAAEDERPRRPSARERKWHLPVVYWVMAVIMLLCTLGVSLLFVNLLFRLRVFIAPGPVLLLGTFAVVSLITGALFSQVFVRSITRPILEMSDAAERIAQGDFDIELTEPTFAEEIEDMVANFTAMAHELAATEMLSADFVRNVSHEMKTPLASISGYATLLCADDVSDEQRLSYAGKIKGSAQRLSSLTDDVLLLSRLENRSGQLERAPFSLSEQLRECILQLEGWWGDGRRELQVDLDEVEVCANAELLVHVWQNLLGNALKFTGPGDRIAVVLLARDDGGAAVRVEDSGIGMDEQELSRIFEKFYQADRSHATEGNGLGLSLCHRIVALHGGTIRVESTPGQGSVFTVELPGE